MPTVNLIIPIEEQGNRFDTVLAHLLPEHSRSMLQTLIERKEVTLNGLASKSKQIVVGGELVTVILPDPDRKLTASPLPLEIIYEDAWIRVINKPAGLLVHPNSLESDDSVVQRLLFHYPSVSEAIYDPLSEVSRLRPGIIHRLDKDTSGVLVTAATSAVLQNISEQFHEHQTEKTYLTLLSGKFEQEHQVQTGMIRKSGKENVMSVTKAGEGREAISHFLPLQHMQLPDHRFITLVRCQIKTGRTHQIRVHAKHIGYPVLGDSLYTNKTSLSISKRLHVGRQMLHAQQLSFKHPETGSSITFKAPLPEDMRQIIADLAPVALEVLA